MNCPVIIIAVMAATLAACAPKNAADDQLENSIEAYPGYTGAYDGFSLVIDERFDDFDDTLWAKGDGAVGGESICRFHDEGIQVYDGVLDLVIREQYVEPGWSVDHEQEKGEYDYICGELRTRADRQFRYGRIETRMKAPNRETASGYISSLFTYTNTTDRESPDTSDSEWEEIDVELEGGRPDKFQANLIYGLNTWEWWRTRAYGAWEDKIEVGPVDEWRVFAIEWVPDAIRWYVDGELVKTLAVSDLDCDPACVPPQENPTPIPDNPTTLIMNFWIPNDIIQDEFGGNKERNVYPMTTRYDWFRYYQLDSHPVAE
ncbi:MAG: family 16 glycosylhydrolase [Pseudomonadota bacterium]